MSDLHKKILKDNPAFRHLPPRPPPGSTPSSSSSSSSSNTKRTFSQRNKQRDYTVIPWTNYWDRKEDVLISNTNKFRVYIKGDSGPVFFFLHGI